MIGQISALTGINLKSVPERWASSLVIVVGLAGVVAVFTALLAMSTGFEKTLASTGSNSTAIVLRGGSDTELNSGMTRDNTLLVKGAPGIRKGQDGKPLASAEMQVIAELIRKDDIKNGANITVRGVEPAAFELRPQLKIVEGRPFQTGLRELVVGKGVTRQFQGTAVGEKIRMRGSEWTVVGVFESGDAYESELWTDVEVAQSTFGRRGFSSVFAALDGDSGFATLEAALKADPQLTVDVKREQEYFGAQTKQFRQTIGFLAGIVTLIMALGAIFAALNTMYAAVAARSREIATLRAIGFGGVPVVASVMVEALVLAFIGGVLGALIAYSLFNNFSVSTLGQNFTQVVFAFKVTPLLVAKGLAIALSIGMIGAFVPAFQTAFSFVRAWALISFFVTAVAMILLAILAAPVFVALIGIVFAAVHSLIWLWLGGVLVSWRARGKNLHWVLKVFLTPVLVILFLVLVGPILMVCFLKGFWSKEPATLKKDPLLDMIKAL